MIKKIALNQRWFSEGEPELGLGIVTEIQDKTVSLFFSTVQELRTYGIRSAPIKRVIMDEGDIIHIEGIGNLEVKGKRLKDELITYITDQGDFLETKLDSKMDFTTAADKLLALSFDNNKLFKSRYDSFIAKRNYQLFKHKGLLGAKVRLIEHQAYITDVVSNRPRPRVLLSDEVGLGKTIESGLILNSLILKNKSKSSLIIVPDSLVYQWFFELRFKFNLDFKPLSLKDELEIEAQSLDEGQNFIISSKKLETDKDLLRDVIDREWDTLIVDEVHQYVGELQIAILDEIASISKSAIFLSATPKINGNENHFKKLEILEPNKFTSFEKFIETESHYSELIPFINKVINNEYNKDDLLKFFTPDEVDLYNSQEKIINTLVDRHGTGRLIFRNTRDHLERYNLFFPKRVLHEKRLKNSGQLNDKIVFSLKLKHLKGLLETYPHEKILLLVHSKEIAKKIHSSLNMQTNIKLALFYSEQSLMERDRQAAFFAEEDGARLLICTEIGSEGRNFEFASHIFLFDIPKVPEQLEQRIGRLDRVGQKKDINIHLPFIEKSFEEILFRWYKDVLESFKHAPKGASIHYSHKKNELTNLISKPFNHDELENFIDKSKKDYQELLENISKGHDALLDINSFNDQKALRIIDEVNEFNQKNDLISYLDKIFDSVGVQFESLNEKSFYIRPTDNMLIPSYPTLTSDGISVTSDRNYALYRDDLSFLSWEHPLTINTIELFTNSEIGNTTLVAHNGEIPGALNLEFIFKLEVVSSLGEIASDFLPVTPIRVFLSSNGDDLTKKFPKKFIDQVVIDFKDSSSLKSIPKDALKSFIKKAQTMATMRAKKYIEKAINEVQEIYKLEIQSLFDLQDKNPLIDDHEINALRGLYENAINTIQQAKVHFDSARVILKN